MDTLNASIVSHGAESPDKYTEKCKELITIYIITKIKKDIKCRVWCLFNSLIAWYTLNYMQSKWNKAILIFSEILKYIDVHLQWNVKIS